MKLNRLLLMVSGVVGVVVTVQGDTHTFAGSSGASWAAAASWSPAEVPEEGDDVIINTENIRVEAGDQQIVNRLNSISIKKKGFYVRSGNTVTIPCTVSVENSEKLGSHSTGTLQFGGKMTSTVNNIEAYGDIRFVPGATFDMTSSRLFRVQQNAAVQIHFACQFPSSANLPTFQTRPLGTVIFDVDDVFANCNPLFVFGTASAPAGILDLNGHDQKIARMTFPPWQNGADAANYNKDFSIRSGTAATLTITKGAISTSSPVSGASGIFRGQLDGGISLKLDADGTGSSVFSLSNVVASTGAELYSSTTGSLICAAGTFKVLDGARLPNLTSLVMEGSGSFEIGSVMLPQSMDVYLAGTGTMKLSEDLSVARAFASDGQGGWVQLGKGQYDNAGNPRIDAASTGRLIVLTDAEIEEGETFTWTGAAGDGNFGTAGNWTCTDHPGTTPGFTSGSEVFEFPANTDGVTVSGEIRAFGIKVASTDGFIFADGGNGCIRLGPGGLDAGTAAGTVRLDCAVAIDTAKDMVWNLGTAVTLFIGGAMSSDTGLTDLTLTLQGVASGASRVTVVSDNSAFYRRLAFDECAYVLSSNVWAFGRTEAVFHNTAAIAPPRLEGIRSCGTPLTMDFPFNTDLHTVMDAIYQSGDGSKFTFGGRLKVRGQNTRLNGAVTEYTGYAMFRFSTDVDIHGGLRAENLSRVQFEVASRKTGGYTVAFKDGAISRGYKKSDETDFVDCRLYGNTPADRFALGVTTEGDDLLYVARATLVCEAPNVLTKNFNPSVNSYTPKQDRWSVIDLNGNDQAVGRFKQGINAENQLLYADCFNEITSESPATLGFTLKNTYTYLGFLKFTGNASLFLGGEWAGVIEITNHVSTTVGSLTVTNGTLNFLSGAGWAGEKSLVTIGGSGAKAGKIQMRAGSCGFSTAAGRSSKVKLVLEDEGTLDIAGGQEISVLNCRVDGNYLSKGTYEVGDSRLAGHVTGVGRIVVRSSDPEGRVGLFLKLR